MEEEIVSFVDETFDVVPVGVINNIASGISVGETSGASDGLLQPEKPKYTDLPPLVNAQEIGAGGVQAEAVPVVDINEDEILFMSEMLWSLPQLAWDRLPDRNPKQIAMFNKALYKYCVKKGIDPNDYFFDEFGIVMASITIGVGIKKDYDKIYRGKGVIDVDSDKPLNKDEKLNVDHQHKKELDEQKELNKQDNVYNMET